ncbi:MAG: cupin domain-containing protein [Desulfobacteraceae bacterium]|jgi:predicted cupin superfamily sugar epimerase
MKPIKLIEHPEGGRFCEVYRSGSQIRNGKGERKCALTHIYFSLDPHEISHFHRVGSDEIWNLYQGKGLYLYLWDGSDRSATRVELSAGNNEFCHVVPAGVWQAAVPIQDKVLVGCSVAPGFEFGDFELLERSSDEAKRLGSHNPELKRLIIA